jgi:4,5-DOPA dioxygenase extradiol
MSVLDKDFAGAVYKFTSRQQKLRAIVVLSAHWQESGALRVTSSPKPRLIYDFAGFPDWLYEIAYPCPGDRAVAQMVAVMLERAGMEARLDPDRGLDHGVWVTLSLAFPAATVPVVQAAVAADARDDAGDGPGAAPLIRAHPAGRHGRNRTTRRVQLERTAP